MILLNEDETIEDLQLNGLRMIQGRDMFRFGEDSVLLANFVSETLKKTKDARRTFVDLGCNCGSISLILSAKLPNASITGVEITARAAGIFERNIELNRIQDRVSCIHRNWNHLREDFAPGTFDYIVSNPPYAIPDFNLRGAVAGKGGQKEITDIRIAREEIHSSLDQLMQISSYLLKPSGRAFFIYRASRMVDVLEGMRKNRIEPKLLRVIFPFPNKAPTAFLIMGQKLGKPGGFVIEKPLVLFDSPSQYTNEVNTMYGKCPPLTREELYMGIEQKGCFQ